MTITPFSNYYPGQYAEPETITAHKSYSSEPRNIYVRASTMEGISNRGCGGAIYSSLRTAIVLCKFVNCYSPYQGGAICIYPGGEIYCTQCIGIGCNTKGAQANDDYGYSFGQFIYSRVKFYNSINHVSELSITTCGNEYSQGCQRPMHFFNGNVTTKLINTSKCIVGLCSCMEIRYGILHDCKYILVDSCESWQEIMDFRITSGRLSYVTIANCRTTGTDGAGKIFTLGSTNIAIEYLSIYNCALNLKQLLGRLDNNIHFNFNNYYVQYDLVFDSITLQNKIESITQFTTEFFNDSVRENLMNQPTPKEKAKVGQIFRMDKEDIMILLVLIAVVLLIANIVYLSAVLRKTDKNNKID